MQKKKTAETATIEDMCKHWEIKKEDMHIFPRGPWRINQEIEVKEKTKDKTL